MTENYKKVNKFILDDDELKTLITEKFQRLQEQIEVKKEVDSKTTNVLHYYLEMQPSEKRNEVAAHYNAKRAESRINAMEITQ